MVAMYHDLVRIWRRRQGNEVLVAHSSSTLLEIEFVLKFAVQTQMLASNLRQTRLIKQELYKEMAIISISISLSFIPHNQPANHQTNKQPTHHQQHLKNGPSKGKDTNHPD